jgi:heme A synthase
MRLKNSSGVAIATAAAMLFSTALVGTAVAGTGAAIHCTGVNSCNGQSACKSANNACKGQNSCKGKGFLEMSKKECKTAQAKMKEELKKPM